MTESTYNLSRKESKRWQNVNTQLLTILTVGIYRTHLYLLRFFHPFNPYNPCSFHHWVFCRTRIYRIDADASLGERVSQLYKIRYIIIIRVRFTSEFFFEHGFIGLTRMLRSWRYCLPDSSHYKSWKSRDFVPGYSRYARYWLPASTKLHVCSW